MAFLQLSIVLATFLLQFLPGAYSSTITVRNECSHPVWPEILSGTRTAEPSTTGFLLLQGESRSFSILMMVAPKAGTGLAANSPVELKIIDGRNDGVAWKSACDAFGDIQYCCSGAFATSDACKTSTYSVSEFSKNARLQGTSTFTCAGADYLITFCAGLSTRFNLIPNVAKPNPQGSFHYWTIPIVRIVVLEYTAAERKTIIHRNRRMLLGLPDANAHSPPSSNEKSLNLDKADPQRPPSPNGNQSGHH